MSVTTQARASYPALSWICLASIWLFWGSTFLGIRVAVQSIPPLVMAGSRYFIAGLLLAIVLAVAQQHRIAPLGKEEIKSAVLAAILLLVIGNGSLSFAEVQIQSGTAAMIVATIPIWMLVFDSYFSKKLQPLALLGIAVGSIGIAVLVGTPTAHVPLLPALAVLSGSLSWALGSVLVRRRDANRFHPLVPAMEMIVAGIVLCSVGSATGELRTLHVSSIGATSLAGYVWLIIAGSIVGYNAYTYAVRTLPTGVVSTYAYVNPVIAVVLGAVLLHEPLTINIIVGGGAILVAVIIILFANRRVEQTLESIEEV